MARSLRCRSLLGIILWVGCVHLGANDLCVGLAFAQHSTVPKGDRDNDPAQDVKLFWELGTTGSMASLRGLSAASDDVIWACGSHATVLRSDDLGTSWLECGPEGMGELEFRSIHAWDASKACIASAGTPAVILMTGDGGMHWHEVYRNDSKHAFFDGLAFWDEIRGIAYSDPVDERLLIVETSDGGKSWSEVAPELLPKTLEGEAGYAASNSSLALGPGGKAWIGTGGASQDHSRIFTRSNWNGIWRVESCPIPSGMTQGVFSIAVGLEGIIAVGGDYRPEAESLLTAAFSVDGSRWQPATQPPRAFRSAVIRLPQGMRSGPNWVSTGPSGSDWSLDGSDWRPFSDAGFHALAANDSRVFAAGSDGRFAVLKIELK